MSTPIGSPAVPDPSDVAARIGQLIVGGFHGVRPTRELVTRISAGELSGVVLFARNLGSPDEILALTSELRQAAPKDAPLLCAVDQEGGRVARLKPPCTIWPPMRALGDENDPELTQRVGQAIGSELAALGFNLDFAPVVDIHTNPVNTVIGDRAFGSTPARVATHAMAFARGLAAAGVLSCAKHYPGHGDTELDSHLALPVVCHPAERLRMVELRPFVVAAEAKLPMIMTAHVVCPCFDDVPATLSERLITDVLRLDIGYQGVVISDDLEMGAIVKERKVPEAAVEAIRAGCDLVLICSSLELQEATRAALRAAVRTDRKLLRRASESLRRIERLKQRPELAQSPAPPHELGSQLGPPEHQALAWRFAP